MKNLIGRLFIVFSLGLSLTLALLWMLNMGVASVAYAANFTVTRTDDPVPNGCNPGDCSLREAIIAANANLGSDTIVLSSATYNLTQPGTSEDAALTGDLDITDTLTISGTGATVINGGNIDRVFHLLGGNFTLSGVTVENGSTSSGGGGLYIDYDVTTTVRVIESTFLDNTAGFGGGLANFGLTTTIVISNSAFINNSATGLAQGYGGGILDFLGFHPYDIVGSSFISNTAALDGGGFDFSSLGGQINITNTTISGNSAGDNGGGINSSNSPKSINLNNVTIFGNTADSNGDDTGDGGGIYRSMGIYNIANTIIAGNNDNSSPGSQSPDCSGASGSIVSAGYNLIGKTDGCNWSNTIGDIIGTIASPINAKLGPLMGQPAYQPLLTNSPAIDAGNLAIVGSAFPACATTDQQGRARPLDGNGDNTARCDIGAYELGFQVNPNGFSFSNFNYYGANWDQFKKAFPGTQMELSGGEHRKGPQLYFDTSYKTIGEGGNCAGFTAVSLIRYLNLQETVESTLLSPTHQNITRTYNFPPVVNGDVQAGQSDVKDYIHLYQARQMSYEYAQWWGQHGNDTPLQTFQAIKIKTLTGEPVAVTIYQYYQNKWHGHRMTAYRTQESGNTGYVYIYDNNWPNDATRRIEVNLSTGEWSYTLGSGETWGGIANFFYSPATVNFPASLSPDYVYGANLFPSANSGDTLLSVNGQAQLLITDSQGHKLGYENGNFVKEIPGAAVMLEEGFNPTNPDATGIEMFYLPTSTVYQIAIQPTTNMGIYDLTAFGSGSAMLLSNIMIVTNTIDNLTLNGSVLNTTFDPTTDNNFCYYITREISGTSSRDFNTCISGTVDIKANFNLAAQGNSLYFENQSGQAVIVQATINQVGDGAGTDTVNQQVSAGQGITIQSGGIKVYLPLIIK